MQEIWTGFIRVKNCDKNDVHFENHTSQIPRKIQILRSFNLNNFITDITMKNKWKCKNIYIWKRLYMVEKDIYFFSKHKRKKRTIKIVQKHPLAVG